MTDTKAPQNPAFTTGVIALVTRLDLNEDEAAALFGVPVHTYRKWRNGTRSPNASAVRLLEVLTLVEIMNPELFVALS